MAGIYVHIPFCKQACHYCNFHFSTSLRHKSKMVDAIIGELRDRKDYLPSTDLDSIYLGGGTPSLLDEGELHALFNAFAEYFSWSSSTEITLEANPDDITKEKLEVFKSVGVNRLSIGIQSFFDDDLAYMNRAHNGVEAKRCIPLAQDSGITDITADLIYGMPQSDDKKWAENVAQMLSYDIPHISAYCLTVEEGTALHHFVQKGQAQPVDNDAAIRQYSYLIDRLTSEGYDHYEISNFGKPGKYAVHNTNYWKGSPYLGLGPGAHSFDGKNVRWWNIAHNPKYISGVTDGSDYYEEEHLIPQDLYNEYIMTGLRTSWGVDIKKLESDFSDYYNLVKKTIDKLIESGLLHRSGENITLTKEGKYLADNVAMQLFVG